LIVDTETFDLFTDLALPIPGEVPDPETTSLGLVGGEADVPQGNRLSSALHFGIGTL